MPGPQLIYLIEPQQAVTGLSGQHRRREIRHKSFGWFRELSVAEHFDGTKVSEATVEIRVNRLAAPALTANWRIIDQDEVPYWIEGVSPSTNRQWWLVRAVRTNNVPQISTGGGGGPATARVGVVWSTDDMIDDAEIHALVTSTSRMVVIPALPTGETSARLILWTAEASGDPTGVEVTMQFADQLNIFDNVNVEVETAENQAGHARISVNPLGAAYAGQTLEVSF